MRDSFLALVLAFALLAPTAAQQPATPAQQPEHGKDEVVRITTNLVQIDAVITNRRGEQITDLAPEDFEIYEDGHLQEIKNFSYITVEQAPVAAPVKPKSKDKTFVPAPPPPPEQLRPEQVRRSIALVVDDLGLSFETTSYVRSALRKFVDEQMHSGDMVAIIRTGAGVGALQQFTTDKRLLHAAIDRVKWNAFGRRGINAFGSVGEDAFHTEPADPRRGRYTSIDPDAEMKGSAMNAEQREAANRARVNDFKDEIFTVGTLGALNYVVKGLKELPGRKSVVLLTDELDLFSSTSSSNFRVLDALRHLIDLANRSSVVFYTIDPRGIPVLNDSAANAMVGASRGDGEGGVGSSGLSGNKLMQDLMSRSLEIAEAENGMNYLAKQTGGFLVNNNNDVAGGIRRVLDQKGYYLIGYRPQESTFNAAGKRNYHKLELRVKRPGLTVHTRAGFYGVSSEAATTVNRTRLQTLVSALTSPFASGAVDLRLTSVFLNDPTYGSFVRSLIHVDGSSLTFTDEADGAHKATVDVAAVTFDDGGAVVDQRFRTETMLVRGDEYRNAQRDGITFGINLPIKKPGAFQLRIAVLDVSSSRVGSANQFIEIPNLNKNKLTLSGLYLAGNISRRQNNVTIQPASGVSPTPAGEGDHGEAAAQAGPAVRSFRPGMMLDYGYEAYNVRLDSSGRAKLQIQLRLFKENQQLFSGAPMDLTGSPNAKRVSAIGHLQLGQNLAPGDYVLQIIVTDIAENKPRVASQWIPFEVEQN